MRVLLLLCVVGVAVANPIQDLLNPELDAHWEDFMKQFNKEYKSDIETNLR